MTVPIASGVTKPQLSSTELERCSEKHSGNSCPVTWLNTICLCQLFSPFQKSGSIPDDEYTSLCIKLFFKENVNEKWWLRSKNAPEPLLNRYLITLPPLPSPSLPLAAFRDFPWRAGVGWGVMGHSHQWTGWPERRTRCDSQLAFASGPNSAIKHWKLWGARLGHLGDFVTEQRLASEPRYWGWCPSFALQISLAIGNLALLSFSGCVSSFPSEFHQ